jgi:UDP-N-acetylglucosamine--N-acetylmuramyl-(pentapeptide) pyrophosphoryl-undecaprenol N-acetylglucosamine transferase
MNRKSGGVLIMAGGTGGHIFPGLAVAEFLRDQQVPVYWLGAAGGMECQRVPAAGFNIDVVNISGLRGKGVARWLGLPFKLLHAIWQAFSHIGRNQPACALSFGGYAAGPGGLAARLRGVPLLVHEQNRIPGLTNKVLARMAKRVFQAFPDTWPDHLKALTCGNPVRREVVEIPEPTERFAQRSGNLRVLITGGSQGALALNRLLPAAVATMETATKPEIRHQAGKGRADETARSYAAAGVAARVDEFIEDMAEAYSWADLVVCRAGALTVSELAAAGIGAILIPYPHAVDDHQTRNAEYLVESGGARLLPEPHCSAEDLAAMLTELLSDRENLRAMAVASRNIAIPDAAKRVSEACMEYVSL